jgi:hypothetical protein
MLLAVVVIGLPAASQAQRRFGDELGAASSGMGPSGRWRRARPTVGHTEMTPAQRAEADRLRSIGYLSGTNPAPSTTGITVYNTDQTQSGVNLYNSGHHAGAILMTMDGEALHEWECPFLTAFPDSHAAAEKDGAEYWRYVHLFENGDVLAIFEGLGLVKVDKDSRVMWAHPGGEHHALRVMDDGRIYVLTRKAHIIDSINRTQPVLEDFITILDAGGRELRSVSVLESLRNSRFKNALDVYGMGKMGDLLHTNAIEVLDGRSADCLPAFGDGNVLVSMRQLNLLAVIDMDLEEAVWIAAGLWKQQHDPRMLDNGNVLLFDNKGYEGQSKVVEFDPVTLEVAWVYHGTPGEPFYSQMCGSSRRLDNGNTLIAESDYGRALEVAPDGSIVWEFVNPEHAGTDGSLIATLFDVVRVDPDTLGDWVGLR